jgi:hypothetical protein
VSWCRAWLGSISPGCGTGVLAGNLRRSVAEPLDPCDENEFVGLVYEERHQAFAALSEPEAAQRREASPGAQQQPDVRDVQVVQHADEELLLVS